jgi:acetolactate synthase I/III small subunit
MKHLISVLVENRAGVLAQIAGLFSARGYNIDSLAVGRTENPATSRMTIVVDGDENIIEQIHKQLDKQVVVLKVSDYSGQDYIDRDLMLLKIQAPPSKRPEIKAIVDIFRANIVHLGPKEMIIEVTGDESKIEALLEALSPFGVKELVRTGTVAMLRGNLA